MRRKIAVMLLVLPVLLSGCIRTIGIKERGLIQAIGIDWEDGQYVVTVQVFRAEGTGGPSTFDITKENDALLQSRGKTISEALQDLSEKQGKQMFLGNNKMIVLGRALCRHGIGGTMDFFVSNNESRSRTYVVAAEDKASDIVQAQIKGSIVPANILEMSSAGSSTNAFPNHISVKELVIPLRVEGLGGCVPIINVEKNLNDEITLSFTGSSIISSGKEVMRIDREQTRGVTWCYNNGGEKMYLLEDARFGTLSVRVKNSKTTVKLNFFENSPFFDIIITAKASITEVVQDYAISEADLKAVEESLAAAICNEVADAIQTVYYENHVDVFNFCRYLKKYQPVYWKEVEKEYVNVINDVRVNLSVRCDIERIGYYQKNG